MFSKGLEEQMKTTTQHTLRENWVNWAHNIAQLELVFTSNKTIGQVVWRIQKQQFLQRKMTESVILVEIVQTSTKKPTLQC